MEKPRISVILPTHNGERFIQETLESFASQHLPIDQLVCSDDNSSDNTKLIISEFKGRAKFDILCLDHDPKGVTANYLNALRYADGDIVFVADQDDVWLNNKTKTIVHAFGNEGVSLVSHDCHLVDESLIKLGKTLRTDQERSRALSYDLNSANDQVNLERFLKGGLPLLAHTLAFKAELIPHLLAKPDRIKEWWFEEWVSCSALTKGRLFLTEEALVLYRQHDSQTSGGISKTQKYTSALKPAQGKYDLRIEKIKYCLQHSDSKMREGTFRSYAEFLERRQHSLSCTSIFTAAKVVLQQLIKGRYHQYANGIKSAGLDLLTNLKKAP